MKCKHELAEFGEIDGEMIYDWYCKHCKKGWNCNYDPPMLYVE